MSLPPLPDGWSQERVNAMIDSHDYSLVEGIPYSDLRLIVNYMNERSRPAREAAEASQAALEAEDDASRQQSGLPSMAEARAQEQQHALSLGLRNGTRNGMWDIVRIMREQGMEHFGFAAVRATCYGQEQDERWQQYKQQLQQHWDAVFLELDATPGEGLAASFRITWIEDETLNGATYDSGRKHYLAKQENREIPNGSNNELFLLVDDDCVVSLLEGGPNTGSPYVYAVDRSDPMDLEEDCRDSVGYFKVAVDALPVDLWLDIQLQAPDELEVSENRIWHGTSPS